MVAHTVGSYDTGGGYHVYPSAIQGQLFDFSGNKVNSPFTVAYTASEANSITNLTNNNFVISWTNNNEVFAQLFNIITYTPTLTATETSSQSKTNSLSVTQTNTPSVTFSSLSRLSSVSPKSSASASPQFSFSPKNSLSPPASASPVSHSGYVVKYESSPSPSSSPLASSVKDYTSSACMNKPLLINFIKAYTYKLMR